MKLKDMTKEELELISYTDLTNMLLKEVGKPMNTPTIFRKICDLLGLDDGKYNDLIGDYYTSLTIDKRFILLENHEWDLRENHAVTLEMDDDDDEDIEPYDEEDEDEPLEEEEEDIEESIDDEDISDDDTDDDLEDLSLVDEEEV